MLKKIAIAAASAVATVVLSLALFAPRTLAQTTETFKAYVTALSAATALTGSEIMYCIQSSTSSQCTPSQILTYVNSSFQPVSNTNLAIGPNALNATLTGTDELAIGNGAGTAITSGASNVALGYQALNAETTGRSSTAVGTQALFVANVTSPNGYNTALGWHAGYSITGGQGNLLLGVGAGSTGLTSGSNNVIVGGGCGQTTNFSNELIICGGASSGPIWLTTSTATPSTSATTISGSLTFPNVTTGTNTDFVCMSTGGTLTLQTSACTISSLRYKERVEDVRGAVLPQVMRLEVADFNLRDTHNKDPNARARQTGLIAENVAQVMPRCAVYDDDMRTPKSYRQECVIAMLVKTVQEQQAEIARMKARHH